MQAQHKHDELAAVDLGSNSFHMIIARLRDGQLQVMDRLREMVQLRAGLDDEHMLSDEAQQRAIDCLQRFGERIRHLPPGDVRIVGTNTLRVARNSREFLSKARVALGHPIEIVAGEEEARLIYLGVAHSLAFDDAKRLVVDIGGGSTEFIIGEGVAGLMRESLEMGCVSFSLRYFPGGVINSRHVQDALLGAAIRLRAIQRPFRNTGWTEAVGASGTIRCIANIATQLGWADNGIITGEALDKLLDNMVQAGHADALQLPGLSEERRSVLAGGACVLKAAFDRLHIDRMTVSDGALREGLLYDLVGRLRHDDVRDRTVSALMRRYQVDAAHAQRVGDMASQLLRQVSASWDLNDDTLNQRLQWACQLHEVGLSLSHDQFHKHSAYLVGHADMPGFSREEQQTLAVMIRGQRRGYPRKRVRELPEELQLSTLRLMVLLRLALVFNRGRSERTDTHPMLEVDGRKLRLSLPAGWLAAHPLTHADLLREGGHLKDIGLRLKLR